MTTRTFGIAARGPFSLQEAAEFGFGQRLDARWDGVMRLAFCLDHHLDVPVGVEVREVAGGVECIAHGDGDLTAIEQQVARVLSLDQDGEVFAAIGERDPVIRRLQEAAPGLRPPLFHSPYEAAVWTVLSARRPRRQMAEVRRRLSEEHGTTFRLAGEDLATLPPPARLLAIGEIPGLPAEKVRRIHGVAEAALAGRLEVDRLLALGPDAAASDLQTLRGIGAFYSSLIVVRAVGFVDVLPIEETHLPGLVAALYGLDGPPDRARLTAMAETWRPMRTWATVLLRAAGPRVLSPDERPGPTLRPWAKRGGTTPARSASAG